MTSWQDDRNGDEPRIAVPRLPATLAAVYSASALILAGTAGAAALSGRSVAYFTREPVAALLEEPCTGAPCSYAGLLSNLGILIWAAGAVTCFLVAAIARGGEQEPSAGPRWPLAFVYAGVLTTALMVDDLLMLHEFLFPALIPPAEALSYGAYALAFGGFLILFRSFVLRTPFVLLLIAGGLFLVSALLDRYAPGLHLLEDGSKFVGIVTWTTYFVATGLACLRPRHRSEAYAAEASA